MFYYFDRQQFTFACCREAAVGPPSKRPANIPGNSCVCTSYDMISYVVHELRIITAIAVDDCQVKQLQSVRYLLIVYLFYEATWCILAA